MEEGLGMNLSEDEAKILIATILDDLSEIGHFMLSLDAFKRGTLPSRELVTLTQSFALNLALGKAEIAKMLISKTKGARPSEAGMKLIAKWERIEDEIIKERAKNEQED
jgi:hypothetical protein